MELREQLDKLDEQGLKELRRIVGLAYKSTLQDDNPSEELEELYGKVQEELDNRKAN